MQQLLAKHALKARTLAAIWKGKNSIAKTINWNLDYVNYSTYTNYVDYSNYSKFIVNILKHNWIF
jgi:hypothetical protein